MYRVLIADDEPIERAVVRKTIQAYFKEEVEIEVAPNGREAIRLFKEKEYTVVLLDIEMPGINGLEAAREIRKMGKRCSIVFLTAFDEFNYAKQAISVKALDYLLKPAADEELIAVIEEGIRVAEEEGETEVREITEPHLKGEESLDMVRIQGIRKAISRYINEHYTKDISLQDIAANMKYSEAYFCKLFKQCFDKNFTAYIAEFRIGKAKALLSDVRINVKEVSDRVGYQNSSYFARVFKRQTGMSPSDYRLVSLAAQRGGQDEK